jgi:hypothetical protein
MNNETTNLDVRYQFMTTDGAAIFVFGTGITYANNVIHGHLKFQTGSPKYYWMNSAHGRFCAPSSYIAMKAGKIKRLRTLRSDTGIGVGNVTLALNGSHINIGVFTVC